MNSQSPVQAHTWTYLLMAAFLATALGCRILVPTRSLYAVPHPVSRKALSFSGGSFEELSEQAKVSVEWARTHGFAVLRCEEMMPEEFIQRLRLGVEATSSGNAEWVVPLVRKVEHPEPCGCCITMDMREAPLIALLYFGAVGCGGELLIDDQGRFYMRPPVAHWEDLDMPADAKVVRYDWRGDEAEDN